jgi:hypothetical protein
MNKYNVTIFTSYTVEVEAESEWEAENIAFEEWDTLGEPYSNVWAETNFIEGEEDYT